MGFFGNSLIYPAEFEQLGQSLLATTKCDAVSLEAPKRHLPKRPRFRYPRANGAHFYRNLQ